MAFENLGVGGTLTFDEKPALAGMRRANQAFHHTEAAAENFRAKMDHLGSEMERFNIVGMGLGSLGIVGLGELGKQAFEAQSKFEDMQVVLSTTLGITRHMDLASSVKLAADEMDRLEVAAAKAPGETEDLLGIYKQIVGPLSAMGKDLDYVQKTTVSTAIMASALGLRFEDAAFGMQKLISGQVQSDDMLFRMLRSQKLITESAEQWKALDQETRLLKLTKVMDKYGDRADQVGNTWTAVSGTVTSIVKIMERAVISPIFEKVRDSVHKLTDQFLSNMDTYKKMGESWGHALYGGFEIFIEALQQLITDGRMVLQWLKEAKTRAASLFGAFGVGSDTLHSIKVHALEIALALGAMFPAFSLLRMVLGPLTSGIGVVIAGVKYLGVAIAEGLSGAAAGLGIGLLPLLGAIAAAVGLAALAFGAMRRDGESFTDTLSRWWTDAIQPFWEGFKAAWKQFVPDILAPLQDAWESLKLAGQLLFGTLAGSLDSSGHDWKGWGEIAGAAVGAIVQGITTMIGWLGQALAFFVFLIANVKYGFNAAAEAISTFFFNAMVGLENVVKGLYNAIITPFQLIIKELADILEAVGKTKIGAKLGFADNDTVKSLRSMIAPGGALGNAAYGDAGKYDFGMSPQEEEYQRQLKRAEEADRTKGMRSQIAMGAMAAAPPQAKVTVEDKRCVEVNAALHVDGKEMAAAQARHQIELMDRSGASASPWQRRAAIVRAKDMGSPR
jgi:hypothetical protein